MTVSATKLDGQVQRCLILADLTRRLTLTDPAGHRVIFRLRPGATSFKRLCD